MGYVWILNKSHIFRRFSIRIIKIQGVIIANAYTRKVMFQIAIVKFGHIPSTCISKNYAFTVLKPTIS